ncbi:S66 peptidase family protein [Tenuibacillus multivorans]|uniref:Muramoyltetrapeptide carboxypeptidase n=1 Tax=Tenuibacillus multivorans TaxID=237069 RepID=A0A1G9W4W4_9BACI|nr:LD-carboxypeptidase [Tenuibacillus multivorans]GEL78755.1 putative murein peptide carboxypeptidase [Tenuibacillus multivorans]SDM79105.1 muramoyltetrapeptide carboxypeptidase [Tenuibacillus multivorans]
MIQPQPLKPGDTIGVIAPASPPNLEQLENALPFFEKLQLNIKLGKHVKNVNGYLAGTDEERLEDLHDMFLDPEVNGIICAGGGYGTSRIALNIDYDLIEHNPKIFWGYSDITYLHTAIRQQTDLVTFHGPMLASDIGKDDFHDISKQSFNQLFQPKLLIYNEDISPLTVLSNGKAEGKIVGGNLSLVVNTLGGPFEIETKDKLLFIEDIDEPPYRIDSFLSQLKNAGKLDEAAGIVIGDFKHAEPTNDRPSFTLGEVLDHYFIHQSKPIIKGFNIGHCQPHFSIPLGVHATLSSETKSLIIQPGVMTGGRNHED